MEERKLTCIGCPMGCQLQVIIKNGIVEKVTGNTCKRGADYGKKEVTDPTRIVTSTVRVQGCLLYTSIRVKIKIFYQENKVLTKFCGVG